MAVQVKRNPETKDGKQTLYLLTYINYQQVREPLKTFVFVEPETDAEHRHNKERLAFAEKVRSARENEFDQGGSKSAQRLLGEGSFIEYFKVLMREKQDVKGSYVSWQCAMKHMQVFLKGRELKIKDCDEKFLEAFKCYLLKCNGLGSNLPLSKNSANLYVSKIKTALNRAERDRVISDNPGKRVSNIKTTEVEIEYLSGSELSILKKADCLNSLLKRAFMFSCFTGLRWSDVTQLKWKNIAYSELEGMWKLNFKQQKTKSRLYHPINLQAIKFLGEKGEPDELVFKNLKYTAHNNKILREWVTSQGIEKHITFHCARHTYAVIMQSLTGNVSLVQDMLGHKDVKTTMRYAKITNTSKNNAVRSFPAI